MENEIWKNIKDYEGLYQVSNMGNVRSLNYRKTGMTNVLKPGTNRTGYYYVNLHKNGVSNNKRIHRLVAMAFIPNPYNKPTIDHIDTIRTNNCVENLRWSTQKENTNNPLSFINYSFPKRGSLNYAYRRFGVLHKQSIPIIQYSKQNEFITEFASIGDAYRATGINKSHIVSTCKGRYKSAGGFIWKYKNEITD